MHLNARRPALGQRLPRLQPGGMAGAHQVQLAPQGGTRLQVRLAVAHHQHIVRLHAIALANLLQQARGGLAAAAFLFGGVGAVEDGVDAPAHRRHLPVHFGVDGVKGHHIQQAPAQPGLVGGHHHMPARVVQAGNGLQRTRHRH